MSQRPTILTWRLFYSIEGSTIIIACSIPTLKPLLNVLVRKASGTSKTGGPSSYQSGSGGFASRGAGIMTFRKNRTKKDKYGMTIATQINDDDMEMGITGGGAGLSASQEKILEVDESTSIESGGKIDNNNHHHHQQPSLAVSADDGNILRTQSVTVVYEHTGTGPARQQQGGAYTGPFKGASASMCRAG
jgi:hypothetical protein